MWRTPVPDVVIAPADVNIVECWRISVTENLEFHSVSDMLLSCIYSAPEARLFNMHRHNKYTKKVATKCSSDSFY